jgi:hypothetical protein
MRVRIEFGHKIDVAVDTGLTARRRPEQREGAQAGCAQPRFMRPQRSDDCIRRNSSMFAHRRSFPGVAPHILIMVPASGYREGTGGRIDRRRRRISAWEHWGICWPVLRDPHRHRQCRADIGIGGIAAPQEQRVVARNCQCIGKAAADVQRRRVAASAQPAQRVDGDLGLLWRDGDDFAAGQAETPLQAVAPGFTLASAPHVRLAIAIWSGLRAS